MNYRLSNHLTRAGTAMAVAAAHKVDAEKLILIRKPSGQLSLRQLSGSYLVRPAPHAISNLYSPSSWLHILLQHFSS